MSSPIERRRLLLGGAALGALPSVASAQSGSGDILEIKTSETATIDGRQWDKTFVGGNTIELIDDYDAVCDHLLVIAHSLPEDDWVVGTYRLLSPARARMIGRVYAENEFDLGRLNHLR